MSRASLVSDAPYPLPQPPLAWGGGGGWTGSLVDLVDAGVDSRVVVVGPGAPDVGCALMKAGSLEVTFVRLGLHLGDCRREVRADVAVVPRPGCLEGALAAVRMCGRMLVPLGTVALGGLEPGWIAPLRAELRRLGFDDVRSWAGPDGFLMRAGLPLVGRIGRLACA